MSERGDRSEPEGEEALWCLDLLTAAERAQLRHAFRRSPELREELEEAVLYQLPPAIREQFVVAFANRLADAPRPPMAVLPALIDAVYAVRPRQWHGPDSRGRGLGER
jgi:hypothetical protein